MLNRAGHVESFGAFIFFALILQLPSGGVIVLLKLIRMAGIKPMRGVTVRSEVEFKTETGLYRRTRPEVAAS